MIRVTGNCATPFLLEGLILLFRSDSVGETQTYGHERTELQDPAISRARESLEIDFGTEIFLRDITAHLAHAAQNRESQKTIQTGFKNAHHFQSRVQRIQGYPAGRQARPGVWKNVVIAPEFENTELTITDDSGNRRVQSTRFPIVDKLKE